MSPLLELVIIDRAEDDLGPATKLLPALKRETNPSTRLVTVDDDTTYHEDLLLALALAADTTKDPVAVGFWCEECGKLQAPFNLGFCPLDTVAWISRRSCPSLGRNHG